jgi:hypothetical protein
VKCCNIHHSYSLFQDGFKYEQARLTKEKVMQQKYKVLSFAIVAALYIFLVPSTSHATRDYASTHTPGETAGPASRSPIKCFPEQWTTATGKPHTAFCTQRECEDELMRASSPRSQVYCKTTTRRTDIDQSTDQTGIPSYYICDEYDDDGRFLWQRCKLRLRY